jgi:glycosyltransferase involved in cell wall biosynthesis
MNLLFISDSSLTNPILSSQGLPHLKSFAGEGNKVYFLSMELANTPEANKEYERISSTYNSAIKFLTFKPLIPKFFSPTFQILTFGFLKVLFYTFKYKIDIIHARSYTPAILSYWVKKITQVKVLFDVRGLVIDECISQGLWKQWSFKTRFMRFFEVKCLQNADHIVAVSQNLKNYLLKLTNTEKRELPISVIPNCVDIDLFFRDNDFREKFKKEYRLEGKEVLLYSGSLAPWQRIDQVVLFFSEYQKINRNSFLLIMTYDDTQALDSLLKEYLLPQDTYLILSTLPGESVKYYSVGDFGILFRQEGLISQVSAPLKFAEYLALKMPVIMSKSIGDVSDIAEKFEIGYVFNFSSNLSLKNQCEEFHNKFVLRKHEVSPKCREIASQYFALSNAIERYRALYHALINYEMEAS